MLKTFRTLLLETLYLLPLREEIRDGAFAAEDVTMRRAGNRVTSALKAEGACVQRFGVVAGEALALRAVVGFEKGAFVGPVIELLA